jgi:hypothetical protein
MDDLHFPTVNGALEVLGHLGVDPDTIDFTCQDWEYTYPQLRQLPDFIRVYRTCDLSDHAKRVLGCFIFQTLDDHLRNGGSETLVRDTLRELKRDYRIHEPEFRYWSLIDMDNGEKGDPDQRFYLTRFAIDYVA